MSEHIDEDEIEPPLVSPWATHITHTVIVTAPLQIRRWTVSEELAEAKAEEYRAKGYTVHIEKGAK